jgi:hypothetical protein
MNHRPDTTKTMVWIKSSFPHIIAAGTTIAPMVPREQLGLVMRILHDLGGLGWNGGFRPS